MVNERCSICDKQFYCYVNGKPICLKHYVSKYVKEDYKKGNRCLDVELDEMVERLDKGNKLNKDDVAFLKEIKSQMPEIIDEFPILFEKVN